MESGSAVKKKSSLQRWEGPGKKQTHTPKAYFPRPFGSLPMKSFLLSGTPPWRRIA